MLERTAPHVITVLALALGAAQLGATRAEAQARRFFDETELDVHLWNRDAEGGYVVDVNGYVYGVGSSQDAIRVDVRAGTRALVSTRCGFDALDGDTGRLRCRTDGERRLTQTGAITVDLVYVDDVAETTTTIRTLNLTVRGYPYWVRNDDRGRPVMGTMYQIDGSDLLGSAFAYMTRPGLRQTEANEAQNLQLFTAFSGSYDGYDAVLRCRVGEERVADRRISTRNYADFSVEERVDSTSDTRRVGWYRTRYDVEDLWWGTRIPLPASGSGYDTTNIVFLGDHPGLWSCDVRSSGATLRTFRFEVDASGYVVAHAVESAPGFPGMLNGLHVVDVRIPSPSPRDAAFDPAPIRAGFQYGTPWGAPSAVAEMLAALPAAMGSSAPTAARGGRGRGRR